MQSWHQGILQQQKKPASGAQSVLKSYKLISINQYPSIFKLHLHLSTSLDGPFQCTANHTNIQQTYSEARLYILSMNTWLHKPVMTIL